MKTWQVLVLAGLFVLVILVLLAALNLAMPFIAGPATPTPPPIPTSTPIVLPTRSPPTPTTEPTSTATPLLVYADPYLPCLKDSYDDLISLMGQIEEALSDEIVLCNLVPAALDDMFEIRINHATCPEPADPTLSLLEFAFATALQSGDSYLRNMDDYCEDSNPWSLQMATDDLEDMAHWIREATIQLANYASQ